MDAADSKAIPQKKPSFQNKKIDDTQMIKCVLQLLRGIVWGGQFRPERVKEDI